MGSVVGADLDNLNRQLRVSIGHEAALASLVLSDCFGSVSEAHRNILGVRSVPEAEVDLGILDVCYRES